jgi:hypothetical protein
MSELKILLAQELEEIMQELGYPPDLAQYQERTLEGGAQSELKILLAQELEEIMQELGYPPIWLSIRSLAKREELMSELKGDHAGAGLPT